MKRSGILAIALFAVSSSAWGQAITPEEKSTVLDRMQNIIDTRAFVPGVDFSRWKTFLEARKEAIEKAETVPQFTTEVNRALREFGFSHIALQSPRQAQARTMTTFGGIGITADQTPEGLRITSVREDGAAKAAGLAVGDVITKVDGNVPQSPDVIRGNPGQKRTLEIKSADGQVRTIEIELRAISTVRPEQFERHGDDAVSLRVWTFMNGYSRTRIEGFMQEAQGAKALVLDLRGNGGGAAANLGHLLSLLMPPSTEYGTFINRGLARRYVAANPEAPVTAEAIAKWTDQRLRTRALNVPHFTGEIAVLINRGSGSASEIAAAALSEQRNAFLVGAPTAGAVLASVFAPLPGGFSLQYPVSDYVTPKGVRIEGNPVRPHLTVTAPRTADGKDPAMEAALAELRKRLTPAATFARTLGLE